MRRWTHLLTICLVACLLAGCASANRSRQKTALETAQYAWSAAIRWGDFEGAWTLVDPKYRDKHPATELQFERYKQIQVSSYRELATRPGEGTAMREIEIGIINRHTMAERTMRYTESWRYDAEAKAWWITNGLPDPWAGE